jgi:TATA-binding protein-associated factor
MDLFTLNKGQEEGNSSSASLNNSKSSSVNNILAALPDLWDTKQYDEEYDLSNFLQGLK